MKNIFYFTPIFLALAACSTPVTDSDSLSSSSAMEVQSSSAAVKSSEAMASSAKTAEASSAKVTKETDYTGMTVEEAKGLAKLNLVPFRVVKEDGESLPVTMDYVVGRINAEVEAGTVTSYTVEGSEETYTQDSWKTMIDPSCTSFFDGCNNCNRVDGSDAVACTKMYCENYAKPRCNDKE